MNPLVSCVMVTGKDPSRRPLALASIQSFLGQTYEPRELVIVNTGQPLLTTALAADKRLREHCLRQGDKRLGDLRNDGLCLAQGEWIAQWDDDDWFHPARLEYQMAQRRTGHAVLLLWQVRVSLPRRCGFALRYDRPDEGIPGTVLHPRLEGWYQGVGKHEDSRFLNDHFGPRRVLLENDREPYGPALSLRLWHGANTWNEKHVMRRYAAPEYANRLDVLPAQGRQYVLDVLREHYGCVIP